MKKTGLAVLTLSIILALVGCSTNLMASVYDKDAKIASDSNSFNLYNTEQTIEGQNFIGTIEQIEGMDTIWTYEAEEDIELDMTYLLNVISGKAKLVLISPDSSLTTLIEVTNESEVTDYATNVLSIKKGLNRIKIVAGENTELNFDITIPSGEFQEIGF